MPRAVLGLGGNLGARRALFACARALLEEQPGLYVRGASMLYHTPPLGPPQPAYLNAALLVDWVGSARSLLSLTQYIEALLLRTRGERWGARTIDIDLLHWSEGPVQEPELVIPHPELTQRLFALVPLLQVAPQLEASLAGHVSPEARAFAPSEPFEGIVRREGDSFVAVRAHDDPIELLCAFVEASAARPARALTTLPFACPLPGPTPASLGVAFANLSQQLEHAETHGFAVRKLAVTGVREGRCWGVFVGERSRPRRPAPRPCWVVEAGDSERAFRLRCSSRYALWP